MNVQDTCLIYKHKKQNEIPNFNKHIWVCICREKTLEKNWYNLNQPYYDTFIVQYFRALASTKYKNIYVLIEFIINF